MQFSDLIHTQSWESVEAMLMFHFPKSQTSLTGYHRAFVSLTETLPAKSEFTLAIRPQEENPSAKYACAIANGQQFDLLIIPWNEVLGMVIEPATLARHTTPEITAYIIWELTFLGFDEDTIRRKKENILSSNG